MNSMIKNLIALVLGIFLFGATVDAQSTPKKPKKPKIPVKEKKKDKKKKKKDNLAFVVEIRRNEKEPGA